jgi:hypothetical protein
VFIPIQQPSKDMDDDFQRSARGSVSGKRRADRIIASVTRDLIIASITVIVLVTLMMVA